MVHSDASHLIEEQSERQALFAEHKAKLDIIHSNALSKRSRTPAPPNFNSPERPTPRSRVDATFVMSHPPARHQTDRTSRTKHRKPREKHSIRDLKLSAAEATPVGPAHGVGTRHVGGEARLHRLAEQERQRRELEASHRLTEAVWTRLEVEEARRRHEEATLAKALLKHPQAAGGYAGGARRRVEISPRRLIAPSGVGGMPERDDDDEDEGWGDVISAPFAGGAMAERASGVPPLELVQQGSSACSDAMDGHWQGTLEGHWQSSQHIGGRHTRAPMNVNVEKKSGAMSARKPPGAAPPDVAAAGSMSARDPPTRSTMLPYIAPMGRGAATTKPPAMQGTAGAGARVAGADEAFEALLSASLKPASGPMPGPQRRVRGGQGGVGWASEDVPGERVADGAGGAAEQSNRGRGKRRSDLSPRDLHKHLLEMDVLTMDGELDYAKFVRTQALVYAAYAQF